MCLYDIFLDDDIKTLEKEEEEKDEEAEGVIDSFLLDYLSQFPIKIKEIDKAIYDMAYNYSASNNILKIWESKKDELLWIALERVCYKEEENV